LQHDFAAKAEFIRSFSVKDLRNYFTDKYCSKINIAVFDVLTAVVMKTSVFWDIMPCSPLSQPDISEEQVASIFRVEEQSKQKLA
jgi:hypothetical protein